VIVSEEKLQVQPDGDLTREDSLESFGFLRHRLCNRSSLGLGLRGCGGGVHGIRVFSWGGSFGLWATRKSTHHPVEEMLCGILVQIKGNLVQSQNILRRRRRKKERKKERKKVKIVIFRPKTKRNENKNKRK
jgi:hypothetical protein